MGFIYTENLQPGMVLASELRTSSGRLLLPAGAVLDGGLIKTLRLRGVLRVDVEGVANDLCRPGASYLSPELRGVAEVYLTPFFRLNRRHDPVVAEIFRLATLHTAERMHQGWQPPPLPTNAELEGGSAAEGEPQRPAAVTLADILGENEPLVSLPEVYVRIVEALESPASSAARLADLVSKDSNLTSRLLRIVNSPCYGFSSRIDSIPRAITLLGANELTTLALGVTVMNAFADIPTHVLDMESFWRHAIACGTFARLLGSRMGGLPGEQLFIGGLLHDIGRLAMLKKAPDCYHYAVVCAHRQQLPLFRVEREIFGFDHGRVGGLLSEQWRFPKGLATMIAYHHYPKSAYYETLTALLHVANLLAAAFSHGLCAEQLVPALDGEAWALTGLYAEDLEALVTLGLQQIDDTVAVFFDFPDEAPAA